MIKTKRRYKIFWVNKKKKTWVRVITDTIRLVRAQNVGFIPTLNTSPISRTTSLKQFDNPSLRLSALKFGNKGDL